MREATDRRKAVHPAGRRAGYVVIIPGGCDSEAVAATLRAARRSILTALGFNPHAKHVRRPSDYVMVGLAVVLCLALVAWALFG